MAANYAFTKVSGIIDKVLLWIHARRLGLYGDGQLSTNNALVLDGVVVGSVRSGAAPLLLVNAGLAAASSGSGGIAFSTAVAGDLVTMVVNLTTPADASANFETTISTTGFLQQTSASSLTGSTYLFIVNPQAAA